MARKIKKRTYSSGSEWDGFRPVAYTLSERVWELPIHSLTNSPSDKGVTPTPTTVGDAFKPFSSWVHEEGGQAVEVEAKPIVSIEGGWGRPASLTLKSSSGEERFSGSAFCVGVLEALLRLWKAGNNPLEASWFFFDTDHVTDDLHARYTFFVVCDDKIVEECISFSDYRGNGFDPAIFSTDDESPSIWLGEEDRHEAWVRFWYRKFYAETRTGQLMVLRPDEPRLYFYPEGRWKWRSTSALARLEGRLQNIAYLLTALAVIALLALIHCWR